MYIKKISNNIFKIFQISMSGIKSCLFFNNDTKKNINIAMVISHSFGLFNRYFTKRNEM